MCNVCTSDCWPLISGTELTEDTVPEANELICVIPALLRGLTFSLVLADASLEEILLETLSMGIAVDNLRFLLALPPFLPAPNGSP